MAQLGKRPTLGFCLGHDLMVQEFKPHIALHWAPSDNVVPAQDSLSLALATAHAHILLSLSLCLSLKINLKKIQNMRKKKNVK